MGLLNRLYDKYGLIYRIAVGEHHTPWLWWFIRPYLFFEIYSYKRVRTLLRPPDSTIRIARMTGFTRMLLGLLIMIMSRLMDLIYSSRSKFNSDVYILVQLNNKLFPYKGGEKVYTKYFEPLAILLKKHHPIIVYLHLLQVKNFIKQFVLHVKLRFLFGKYPQVSIYSHIPPSSIIHYARLTNLYLKILKKSEKDLKGFLHLKFMHPVTAGLWYYVVFSYFHDKINEATGKRRKHVFFKVSYTSVTIPMIILSKRQGIISIEFQHGLIVPSHPGYYYNDPMSNGLRKEPIPDYFLSFGEIFSNMLHDGMGFDTRMIVTGDLRRILYEKLSRQRTCGETRDLRVLIATQKLADLRLTRTFIKTLMDSIITCSLKLKSIEKILVEIKPHPMETSRKYRELIGELYSNLPSKLKILFYEPTDDINQLIARSDILISLSSTTILEAVKLGTPSIIWDIREYESPLKDLLALYDISIPVATDWRHLCMILEKISACRTEEILSNERKGVERIFAEIPINEISKRLESLLE